MCCAEKAILLADCSSLKISKASAFRNQIFMFNPVISNLEIIYKIHVIELISLLLTP